MAKAHVPESAENLVVDKEEELISEFRSCDAVDYALVAIKKLLNYYADHPTVGSPISKLYDSLRVQSILQSVVRTVLALEKLGKGQATEGIAVSSGCSLLITGIRGVGKTTLMKGLARVLSAACEFVLPIYWDYEQMELKLPATIILEQLQTRRPSVFTELKARTCCIKLLNGLQARRIYVAFFADEIQHLYKSDAAHDTVQVSIVKQLLSIGKEPNCFGVLSSSSANIATLAFKRGPEQQRYHEYPNLNSSVFAEKRLVPLRDRQDLQRLLEVRFPNLVDDIDSVFMNTGGVGRNIDQFPQNKDNTNIVNHMCNSAFRAVVHRLCLKNEALSAAVISWNQRPLSHTEVTFAMEPYMAEEEHTHALNEWLDCGLLYANNNYYELLLPRDYHVIKHYLAQHPDRFVLMALEATFRRWDGYESVTGVKEKYILRRLFEGQHMHALPFAITWYNERCLSSTLASDHVLFKDVPMHCGELLYLARDQSIDGAVFEKDQTGLKVHLIQISIGGISRANRLGTLAGIMKCAEDAAKDLQTRFLEHEISCEFVSFTLVTNKQISNQAQPALETCSLLARPVKVCLIDKENFYAMFPDEVLIDLGLEEFIGSSRLE